VTFTYEIALDPIVELEIYFVCARSLRVERGRSHTVGLV
jgi:hypothetical protein